MKKEYVMKPIVSIIMGSASDMPIVREAAEFLNEMQIAFEINALSAHRVPEMVAEFAKNAEQRGVRVIIAAAGGAAHLPGVVAAFTTLPVVGIPIKSSNSVEGLDSILSILQMPAGVPVATMALNGAKNAAIFAAQILATADENIAAKMKKFKADLAKKIAKANEELSAIKFDYKTN